MDVTLDYIEARGEARGKAEGKAEGADMVNTLGIELTKAGRLEEFLQSLSDANLQKKLFIEFGLEN